MLAERRKLSVTRISRSLAGLVLLLSVLVPASGWAARGMTFGSPQAAFEQGMGALRAGRLDKALPALEHAAGKGFFLAQFYLARIFADPTAAYTDHAKAYVLYQRLADEYADIDPDDDQRAPFVAKSFTALAGYLRRGVPEIKVEPNPARAAEYLHHAATFFNDQDAQFELAKLYLKGEGVQVDTKRAVDWLAVLTEKGHAGAQAFLADLYWLGDHVEKSPLKALALVTVAVEHAPAHERIWIEDIHQNIYCGLSEQERKDAEGLTAFWRTRYGKSPVVVDRYGLSKLQLGPVRSCSNGELVRVPGQGIGVQASNSSGSEVSTSSLRRADSAALPLPSPAIVQGNSANVGVRDAGEIVPDRSH